MFLLGLFALLQKQKKVSNYYFLILFFQKYKKTKKEYEAIDESLVNTNDASLYHIIIYATMHWGLAMGLSQIPMLFGILFFLLKKFVFN